MKKVKVEQLVELFITLIIISLAVINISNIISNQQNNMTIWIIVICIMSIITLVIDYILHKIYISE